MRASLVLSRRGGGRCPRPRSRRLAAAVRRRRTLRTLRAALNVQPSVLDLELRYRPRGAVDRDRLEWWCQRLRVDARARDAAAVSGDAATLGWLRERIAGGLTAKQRRGARRRARTPAGRRRRTAHGGRGRPRRPADRRHAPDPATAGAGSAAPGLAIWPPVPAAGTPRTKRGALAAKLATITGANGKPQLTYDHHPLYYYVGDSKPGQTNGQGLNQFGAEWYVLAPSGEKIDSG